MSLFEIDDLIGRERRVFTSSLRAINELFGGEPYSSTEMFTIYGLPAAGKTLFVMQEAAWLEAQGYKVLLIDTEGGIATAARKWLPTLRARFKDMRAGDGKIYGIVKKTIEGLAQAFGWQVVVEIKGAKTEFRIEGRDKGEGEIVKSIRTNKIDFVILDSVTMPIRTQIPSVPQSLAAKSDVEGFMFGRLASLQDEFGVGVIVTNHASINPVKTPMNSYSNEADIRGGVAIKHMSKHIVYLDKRDKTGMRDIRRFWLIRAPDKPEWSDVRFARITDMGFVDVDWSAEYLTDGELSRIERHGGVLPEGVSSAKRRKR